MQNERIECVSPNFVRIYTQREEKDSKQVITAIYVYMGVKNGEEETSDPKYAIIADDNKKVIRVGICWLGKDTFKKAVQIKVKDENFYDKMEKFLKRMMKNFTYFEKNINEHAGFYNDSFLGGWPVVKENKIFVFD